MLTFTPCIAWTMEVGPQNTLGDCNLKGHDQASICESTGNSDTSPKHFLAQLLAMSSFNPLGTPLIRLHRQLKRQYFLQASYIYKTPYNNL